MTKLCASRLAYMRAFIKSADIWEWWRNSAEISCDLITLRSLCSEKLTQMKFITKSMPRRVVLNAMTQITVVSRDYQWKTTVPYVFIAQNKILYTCSHDPNVYK